jgi:hypothetical protein
MQGIVDVNAARSFYNGVLAELNDYGAVFTEDFTAWWTAFSATTTRRLQSKYRRPNI